MVNLKTLLLPILLLLAAAVDGQSQEIKPYRFNPDYSFRDIRAGYGTWKMLDGNRGDMPLFEMHYTSLFWGNFAYRVGGQFSPGMSGYNCFIGAPVAVVFRPGTRSLRESLEHAAGASIYGAARTGVYQGNLEGVGRSILATFIAALFRRTEYFVGLTPAYLGIDRNEVTDLPRSSFMLTADAGIVFSIPIWRICLNISPTYHFAFTRNFYFDENRAGRNCFSFTGGLTYLF